MFAMPEFSVPPAIDEPENQGEHNADNNRCSQRKVDHRVLAAISDISGKTPQGKIEAPRKQEDCADQDDYAANNEQQLAYVCHADILAARKNWPRISRIDANQ